MLGPDDLVLCGVPLAHVPLLDRLRPAREAGFAGVSFQPGDVWALERDGMPAAEIAARIADGGLMIGEIDCVACWLPAQHASPHNGAMARMLRELTPEAVIATAARVGARSITAVEMFAVDSSRDEAVEAFAALCDRAAEHGLLVHIEFLPFGGIPDLATAWDIVAKAGRANGGLTIDAWHLLRTGGRPADLVAIPGEKIFTVQLCDAPAEAPADLLDETMNGRLLPGEGAADCLGLIQMLDRIGSRAPVGVEVFSRAQTGLPVKRIAHDWARAGRVILKQARDRA